MAAVASSRLTSLPAELLIKILELLPVRETFRLRIISRVLKGFVDKHEKALARITAECHRQRLLDRLRWLLDLDGLSLLDILHRYTSYYGHIGLESPHDNGQTVLPSVIGMTLAYKFPKLSDDDSMEVGEKMLDFWLCFMECHKWMHCHSFSENNSEAYAEIKRTWERAEIQAAHLTDPDNVVEYLRARLQDRSLLQGPRYTDKHGLPRFPITSRPGLQDLGQGLFFSECGSLLRERFQLPFPLKAGFAYCVKTQRRQDIVYITSTSTEPWKTALLRSPFRQAAMLEEMFVF
ncbi:hypothetical protein LTR95_011704 [Oleoguttula sp. CCFEE 5521]